MNENMLQCDWIDDILNETIYDDLTIFDQDTSELYDMNCGVISHE